MNGLPPPRIDILVHSPSPSVYRPVLEQLLEPSPPLSSLLAPQLHERISSLPASSKPKSYSDLLDLAAQIVNEWDVEDQAAFLASHPRIGETKNLSKASEGEQAPQVGQQATPAQVLKRLQVRDGRSLLWRPSRQFLLATAADRPQSISHRCSTRSTRTLSRVCDSSRSSTVAREQRLSPNSR